MKITDIKKLIKEFEEAKIHKLEVEIEGTKISMEKESTQHAVYQPPMQTIQVPQNNNVATPFNNHVTEVKNDVYEGEIVYAPLVGTYYASPSPDSESFINVGDKVKKGDILCIIEAMKVMNEITAPCDGVIKKILASNEDVIEYDQPLVVIG